MPGRYLDVTGEYESVNHLDYLESSGDLYCRPGNTFERNDSFDSANFSSSEFSPVENTASFDAGQRYFGTTYNPYSYGSVIDTDINMSSTMFSNFNPISAPSQYNTSESPRFSVEAALSPQTPFFQSCPTPDSDCSDSTSEPSSNKSGDTEEEETTKVPPKRKVGRPRQQAPKSSDKPSPKVSQRIPHNRVERKYRDGLNSQLEHLRLNVPTLPVFNPDSPIGPPKPGKMAVLAAAVDYIKSLEAETKRLTDENEELRCHDENGSRSLAGNNSRKRRKQTKV